MMKFDAIFIASALLFLIGCSVPVSQVNNIPILSENGSNSIAEIAPSKTSEVQSTPIEQETIEEDPDLTSDYAEVPVLPNKITKPKIVGASQKEKERIQKTLDKFNDEALNKLSFVEVKSYLECRESGEKSYEICTTGEYIVEPASTYYSVMRMTIIIYDLDRQTDSSLMDTLRKGLRHHYEYQKYGDRIFEQEGFIESASPPSFFK